MIQNKNIIKLVLLGLLGILFLFSAKDITNEIKEVFQNIGIIFLIVPLFILVFHIYKIFKFKKKISTDKIREMASTSMKIQTY